MDRVLPNPPRESLISRCNILRGAPPCINSISSTTKSLPNGNLGLRARTAEEKAVSQLVSALKQCADLKTGKKLHEEAVAATCHTNKYVAAVLIKMYSRCRRMDLAQRVFDELTHRDVVIWTSLVQGYVDNNDHVAALRVFDGMSCEPNSVTYVAALKACGRSARGSESEIYLHKGIGIHRRIQERGLDSNLVVATSLLSMYCKFGRTRIARKIFDRMVDRSVVTWTTLILGYAENGEGLAALEIFSSMDCKPDTHAFAVAVKACGSLAMEKDSDKGLCLQKGQSIHKQAVDSGLACDSVLGNALVDMYSKCDSMRQAREVFDSMIHRNVVSWTSIIQGYAGNGESSVALELFASMSCEPNAFTYVAALKACGSLALAKESEQKQCLEKGIGIHKQLIDGGLDADVVVATNLVDMYCKCRSMKQARAVFDELKVKTVITWNTLALGYVENGNSLEALKLLSGMSCEPDSYTHVAGLKACSRLAAEDEAQKAFCFERGILIHREVKRQKLESDVVVATALLDMYSKCGSIQHAREVFETTARRNVYTWTSLIQGYVETGGASEALELFSVMDCEPNSFTYVAALRACGALAKGTGLDKAVKIHQQVKDAGLGHDVVVANALIDVYCKCKSLQQGREVFDGMKSRKNVISWTTIISGYVGNGDCRTALSLFADMDCQPNSFTYVAALKACGALAGDEQAEKSFCLRRGMDIHEQARKDHLDSDYFVSSALLDMYCKCGSMRHAKEIFDRMPQPDVVAWTSLMQGYAENGESLVAMDLFTVMDCEADKFTYVAALKAAGSLSAVSLGQELHGRICKLGLEQDQMLASTLIDFYAKCGSIARAEDVFNSINSPDIISWNTIISGYSTLGLSSQVFSMGRAMQEAGLRMDEVTLLSILTACSHSGLVRQGQEYFDYMLRSSSRTLNLKHYRCMVDMLGRANRLHEALTLVRSMPFESDVITWTTVLGACRKWKNLEIGKLAFDELAALETKNAAAYVLMSEIYGG